VQQVIDIACPSAMLRDKDIHICRDADAEKQRDDPRQREVAGQHIGHRGLGNTPRCAAAGRWLACADSAHKGVVSPRRIARRAFFTHFAFQFVG
jgi:hypothetical protein